MSTPSLLPARRAWLLLASACVGSCTIPAWAQHGGGSPTSAPPREAAQFDFLIGQWELEVTPKTSGLASLIHGAPRLSGLWKAWRAFDGHGIEDELRIVDASANPVALSHSLRIWDSRSSRWQMHALDVYRARLTTAQAQWQDGEMRAQGSGTSAEGKAMLTRTRFFDIGASGFRMRQDRSLDNGASWDDGVLQIAARRTAARAAR